MADKVHKYSGARIDVTYDSKRCIHAAECVKRLSIVFDRQARPWIQPENAPADTISAVIAHCPSGALAYERKDSGPNEPVPAPNTILLNENGPLYVRGKVTLKHPNGEIIVEGKRMALCRCGASQNKPFCDNRHKAIGYNAPGGMMNADREGMFDSSGVNDLTITPSTNGPYELFGDFEILNAAGETIFKGSEAALCRCGGSQDKPFCDGTHEQIGFQG